MMTSEMKELVRRNMKEKYGWIMKPEDFSNMTHYDLCVAYFNALAYFKVGNHYFSLEDVENPIEGKVVFIREHDTRKQYKYIKGEWVFIQDTPDYCYKD